MEHKLHDTFDIWKNNLNKSRFKLPFARHHLRIYRGNFPPGICAAWGKINREIKTNWNKLIYVRVYKHCSNALKDTQNVNKNSALYIPFHLTLVHLHRLKLEIGTF